MSGVKQIPDDVLIGIVNKYSDSTGGIIIRPLALEKYAQTLGMSVSRRTFDRRPAVRARIDELNERLTAPIVVQSVQTLPVDDLVEHTLHDKKRLTQALSASNSTITSLALQLDEARSVIKTQKGEIATLKKALRDRDRWIENHVNKGAAQTLLMEKHGLIKEEDLEKPLGLIYTGEKPYAVVPEADIQEEQVERKSSFEEAADKQIDSIFEELNSYGQ